MKKEKLSAHCLSDKELAQLKGGADRGIKNTNKAAMCKCDNKPAISSNLNSQYGCTCNCSPGM